MKKIVFAAAMVLLLSATASTASADQISFVWNSSGDTIQGVDGDTSWWSNDDSLVNLNAFNLSLLNGSAEAIGFDGCSHGTLTQRGTRGLGIFGGEDDEIDSYDKIERLVFKFDNPVYLNSFEVRSLYYESCIRERGTASFFFDQDNIFTQQLIGQENINAGGDGIVGFSYGQPYLIDKIVFNVPAYQWYTCKSEFSVAKLNVSAVPEPIATVLFLTGGAVLMVRQMRRKVKS